MIYKKCIMTINKNNATLDEDIYLFRLDKNIELHFSIVNNRYKFDKSDLNNIIAQTNAAYFQIRLYRSDEIKYTFAIQPTQDGVAVLTITDDLINDPIELGEYDFQISLLDADKTSMISMPIVKQQLHVCEPLVDNQAIMGRAVLGLSSLASGEIKNAFDSEGNYIREIHKDGDILSAQLVNKFEEALDANTKAIKAGTGGGGTGGTYDDTAIKADINAIKTELGTDTLTTTAQNIKGAINEVAAKIGTGTTISSIEPELMDMPRIYFSEGTLPTSKTATVMKFDYYSKTATYHGYVDIKCQGTSSMGYPKKNFTIKPYKDKAKTSKLKLDFKGWGKQSKFVLKANWIDITHARNVVSARLWGDIVKTRADYTTALPELLRTSPNQGAIDGFPVLVYSNGVYQGRYTLNIPKDKWMSNMDDTLDTHCILCGENYQSGCFRALPQINGNDWTDELHDVVPANIKTSWSNAINFVMNSSDTEFKANLSNYFDVNSLIDYYLYGLVSTNLDGFGKNQLFFSYDGIHWIASVYDLDSTWGLYWNGSKILPTDYRRNQYEDYVNSTGNLLYNRLEQLFISQLKARYTELRKDVLSASHIIQKFEEFNQICPKDIVQEDYASTTGGGKFTGIPSTTTNNIQQIRSNIVARLTYTDNYINALQAAVPCTNITLNKTTLSFTTDAAQTLTATVTPTNTTDKVVWSVSPTGIVTVNNGVVTPISNGTCVITATCGSQKATCNVTVNLPVAAVTALNLDKDSITLGDNNSKFEDTLTATLTPTNATNKNVTWTASNENVELVANGLKCTVKAKAVGNSVVTCTSQDTTNGTITDTCNVTINAIPEQPNVLYTLPQETTFNGTSDYIDTGVQLLKTDQDFTITMDVTADTPMAGQTCIMHCMKEQSPYPGIVLQSSGDNEYFALSKGNNTSAMTDLIDYGQRTKVVIVKNGTTIKVYTSNGTNKESAYNFTSIEQTLLLGAYQTIGGTKGRFFKGTIHEFSIINAVYTEEQIKDYLGIVSNGQRIFKIDSTCMNTTGNKLTDSIGGIEATLGGAPTVSNNQIVFTENDNFSFDISSLKLTTKNRTLRVKFTPTSLDANTRAVCGIGAKATSWNTLTSAYITKEKLIMQHGSANITNFTVGDRGLNINRLPITPSINTEYEIVITEEAVTGKIRWFVNGTLVQDGTVTLYNPLFLANVEGNGRFVGSYSLIEIYDTFCDTYEDFNNIKDN